MIRLETQIGVSSEIAICKTVKLVSLPIIPAHGDNSMNPPAESYLINHYFAIEIFR